MERCVLVDQSKLRELRVVSTVYKINNEISWIPDYAYKFLVTDYLLLVIGTIGNHDSLYAAWSVRSVPTDQYTEERVDRIADQQHQGNSQIIGAGTVDVNGVVIDWKSECYRLRTPMHMRAEIEQDINQLLISGQLTPQWSVP